MTWLPDAMTSVLVGYDIGWLHTGRAAAMRAHDWTTIQRYLRCSHVLV